MRFRQFYLLDGGVVLVNLEYVASIEPTEDKKTRMWFKDSKAPIDVEDSFELIALLLVSLSD